MKTDEIIKKLLNTRGITSDEAISEFLSDKPRLTHEPELMPDIEAGARLILDEIKSGGKICIYGDYDADGITATTLMLSVLGHLMPEDRLIYYIPSRFDEGYGLNLEAINLIKSKNVTMILTVDCGSISTEEVEYAKSLGLRILVTDHHNITDKMSDCLLINPKRPDSKYPFRELSGCGVAFKLAQMIQKLTDLPKRVLTEVLDLVAIGTIGDLMPLTDENRTLVKFGLRAINQTERPGLIGLIEGASLKPGSVTAENVGYVIVPHLNASGRMEDASLAVKLLAAGMGSDVASGAASGAASGGGSDVASGAASGMTEELRAIVSELLTKNQERKRIQNETYKRAQEIMALQAKSGDAPEEKPESAADDSGKPAPAAFSESGKAGEKDDTAAAFNESGKAGEKDDSEKPAPAAFSESGKAGKKDDPAPPPFNIVRLDDAHEGIIGIVAGKLKDDYNRPTIIVTPIGEEKTILKGTGRSIEGVNLHEILDRHSELFEKFGGHSGACGFTMPIENLDILRNALISDMKELIGQNPALFEKKVNVDFDLDFNDISLELAAEIAKLAPFGTKNPKPAFRISDVLIKDVKYMGIENQHVRFSVLPEFCEKPSKPLWCVIFNKAEEYKERLSSGALCDLTGSLELQSWQDQIRMQFLITDIKFSK